jgi:hypothetical protein
MKHRKENENDYQLQIFTSTLDYLNWNIMYVKDWGEEKKSEKRVCDDAVMHLIN